MPRNQQGNNKFGEREKSNSSDTFTWAPGRSPIETKMMDKPDDNKELQSDATKAKEETVVQNTLKTKIAEMESYIPKPAAEVLARQGSIQQPVVWSQNIETTQHGDSIIISVGPIAESNNGDSNQNKLSKVV